jgi:hypothetical protein
MIRTFCDSGVPIAAARSGGLIRRLDEIEAAAQTEAAKAGLAAMDALHVAAAHLSHADEFVTTEKPDKAIHRSSLVKVVCLFR